MEAVFKPFGVITDWSFMNEPLWRWFMFFGAVLAIGWAWNGILSFID